MKTLISQMALAVSILLLVSVALVTHGSAQTFDRIERGRMKDILKIVHSEVKEKYYDPTYHGIDLEARFKQAEEKLDQATSTPQSLAIIAQVLIEFNDSHLFFVPPATNLAVEYGWRMQAIGDKVYVTQVKPGSDAEAKGLKPGDQILSIGEFQGKRPDELFCDGVLQLKQPGTASLTLVRPNDRAIRYIYKPSNNPYPIAVDLNISVDNRIDLLFLSCSDRVLIEARVLADCPDRPNLYSADIA